MSYKNPDHQSQNNKYKNPEGEPTSNETFPLITYLHQHSKSLYRSMWLRPYNSIQDVQEVCWKRYFLHIFNSQLLQRIILNLNSSSIALPTLCIAQCCHSKVFYFAHTNLYCFVYWLIQENIAQLPGHYGESTHPILPYQKGQYWKQNFWKGPHPQC